MKSCSYKQKHGSWRHHHGRRRCAFINVIVVQYIIFIIVSIIILIHSTPLIMITVLKLTTGIVGGIPLAAASSHQAATSTVTPNIRTWGGMWLGPEWYISRPSFLKVEQYTGSVDLMLWPSKLCDKDQNHLYADNSFSKDSVTHNSERGVYGMTSKAQFSAQMRTKVLVRKGILFIEREVYRMTSKAQFSAQMRTTVPNLGPGRRRRSFSLTEKMRYYEILPIKGKFIFIFWTWLSIQLKATTTKQQINKQTNIHSNKQTYK